MSYYSSSLPVSRKSVYSSILNGLKNGQYMVRHISVCFYNDYTEYSFYSSDDEDAGYGIAYGVTAKYSGNQAKCSFFCSGPSHYMKSDPMVDESDFRIPNEYASYLKNLASKKGFTVNHPEGYMASSTVFYNESDAYRAYARDKEIKQQSSHRAQPQKDNSITKVIIGVIVVVIIIYLFK